MFATLCNIMQVTLSPGIVWHRHPHPWPHSPICHTSPTPMLGIGRCHRHPWLPTATMLHLHLTLHCPSTPCLGLAMGTTLHLLLGTALLSPCHRLAAALPRACHPQALCLSQWAASHRQKPPGAPGRRTWQQPPEILLVTEAAHHAHRQPEGMVDHHVRRVH